LKNKLTQRFCKTNEQRLSRILSSCRRGNLTVQGYLSELRATLGSHYGGSQLQNDLIRHCLMVSIDTTTQKLLTLHDNLTLVELTKKAVKLIQNDIYSTGTDNDHSYLSKTPTLDYIHPQRLINEAIDTRISSLQRSLDSTPQTHANTAPYKLRSSPNALLPPNSASGSSNLHSRSRPCRYHCQFGSRAFKCEGGPCPINPNLSPNHQEN